MKNDTNVAFADNLRRLMRARKLNDVELARAAGLSHTAIANYKKGRLPKVEALHKLAAYFQVSLDDLLHGAEAGMVLRIAAKMADQLGEERAEVRQGRFEAVTRDLLRWKERATVAEEKLGRVQAALGKVNAEFRATGTRRGSGGRK